MTRVGAIDCGTNSIRLLIADVEPGGSLHPLVRDMEVVRLGRGVDATGRIAPESMELTLQVARDYARRCTDHGCQSVRFVATSASRDAENAAEFVAGVQEAFGSFDVVPEVVTGDEEASLSFAGATADLRAQGVPAPYLVVDIGGGSTEFVRGEDRVEESISTDIGSVRLTERHLHSDPPGEEEIWPALGDVTRALDEVAEVVSLSEVATLVGVAGSVTTTTAHALGLDSYRREAIHGATLPASQVVEACTSLAQLPRADRGRLPYMHPGRVDVIGAGALIWRSVIQRLVHDAGITHVRASEQDILDGIALSQA